MKIHSLRLPLQFDSRALQSECDAIPEHAWVRHYNQSDYEGDWSGVALRSRDGSSRNLVTQTLVCLCDRRSRHPDFIDTPILQDSPYFKQVLSTFEFPLGAVRLLALRPESLIREHCDPALSYEEGEVRLHIPVRTSSEVDFYLDQRRLALKEGEAWYLNLSLPHRIHNRGARERIHLVIDGMVNPWLAHLFSRAGPGGSDPRAERPEPFELFRRMVLQDMELRQTLLAESDKQRFILLAVELARQREIKIAGHDVEIAIRKGLRAWHRRSSDW